jgi:hypothetical protein
MSAERAAEARKKADQLACVAWNMRMLGYKGPAQPSPTLGDALSAGCAASAATHTQHSFAGDRQASQDDACVWLERYLRCKDCSQVRKYPYKRSHLVALRPNKISTLNPPSIW